MNIDKEYVRLGFIPIHNILLSISEKGLGKPVNGLSQIVFKVIKFIHFIFLYPISLYLFNLGKPYDNFLNSERILNEMKNYHIRLI